MEQVEVRKKTLDRAISQAGLGSRADARRWIAAGKVRVNGREIRTPDHWVDPKRDRITLDGKRLNTPGKLYILLYKPKGYLTTRHDPQGRRTVYHLVGCAGSWLAPAGRLDLDTSGLLIMTNDTLFADRITDPESHVPKTYLVKTSSRLDDEALALLRSGVVLGDGPTRPAIVKRMRDSASSSFLELTITEGRNRQVRRMIEAVGSKVRKLVRVAIGDLCIGDLQIGQYRELTPAEVARLAPQDRLNR